jgi:hypothetical protein
MGWHASSDDLRTPGRRTAGGFSLTQSLIILAIIGLAASVFFPALRVQCEAARRASKPIPSLELDRVWAASGQAQ